MLSPTGQRRHLLVVVAAVLACCLVPPLQAWVAPSLSHRRRTSVVTSVVSLVEPPPSNLSDSRPLWDETPPPNVPWSLQWHEGQIDIRSPLEATTTTLLQGLDASVWTAQSSFGHHDEDASSSSSLILQQRQPPTAHSILECPVGDLVGCTQLLACARLTRYWMGPKVGTSAKDLPLDTQFLLLQVHDDNADNDPCYALVLPLVDQGFRASLQSSGQGLRVICYAETGATTSTASGLRALYLRVGDDPFRLLQQGVQHVSQGTGTFRTLRDKQLPSSVDNFGWCTWDAFYSKVTPAGILQGVESLSKAGVPPRTIIIDDGWQQVNPLPPPPTDEEEDAPEAARNSLLGVLAHVVTLFYETCVKRAPTGSKRNRFWRLLTQTVLKDQLWAYFDAETDFHRQLSGFAPNDKFENEEHSLKQLVSNLKTKWGVQQVLCWHALHGYWRGVSEDLGRQHGINVTNVFPKASNHMLRLEPQLAWDTVSLWGVGLMSDPQNLARFYEKLHAPLVEAGIDGVKVDVQSGVSAVGGEVGGGPHLAQIYTQAMETSVRQNFGDDETGGVTCINCMCHSTENLYRYQHTSVARASEDFFPNRPETHTVHLINVAYNSLFLGEICLPDWDMFQSLHPSADLHAAARAVGGCPIYVSDHPGQHNATLLQQLVLPNGEILRAQLPGRPTRDCLFANVGEDGTTALKIWNANVGGGGVVGAFHVQGVAWNFATHENDVVQAHPAPLVASVRPHDVETLRHHDGPFAVWQFRAGRLTVLATGSESIEQPLQHKEWEIFTIAPIQVEGGLSWAPIGLANMMNSGGALVDDQSPLHVGQELTTAHVTVRGVGRWVGLTNQRPDKVLVAGQDTAFVYDDSLLSLELAATADDGRTQITVIWTNR